MIIKAPLTAERVFPDLSKTYGEMRRLSFLLEQRCVRCNVAMKSHDCSYEAPNFFICPQEQQKKLFCLNGELEPCNCEDHNLVVIHVKNERLT